MIADTSLFNISVDGLSGKLTVLSFTLEEGIYGDDLLTVSLLSRNKLPDSLADKDVSFSFEYEGKKEFFYGPVTNCTAEQTATGASAATIKAKTIRHLLDKEKKCAVYCKSDVEDIANSILGKAKISNAKLSLSKYYETAFKVQYNESDLAFLQRIFEEHNIIEFVQHSGNGSELVVSDGNDFAVSGSTFIKCCLEGTEAGNIFHGYSHNALRPGQAFDAFDETFIVCSASHTGSQAAAFGIKGEADGYTCQVTAFSKRMLGSLPCRKNKPQVPGVIVAKVEGYKDAPAAIDSQGRYIVRMPFDEKNPGMASSAPVHLAQSFAGENCGIHFPLRRGTPVLVAFEDGDIDKPIALGALPSGQCAGPASHEKSFRNILRTISGMELVLDDDAKSMSVKAPESISAETGKEFALKSGEKMVLDSSKELALKSGEKLVLEAKKQNILKAGSKVTVSLDDSSGALKIDASGEVTIKASGKVAVQGKIVEMG